MNIPFQNLVAWFPFDGDARDYSGAGYELTVTGATFAPGQIGQAASFDGVNDILEITDAPAPLEFSRLQAFSVCAWVKIDSSTNDAFGRIVGVHAGSNAGNSHGYMIDANQSGNQWRFQFANASGQSVTLTNSNRFDTDWHFICARYNGSGGMSLAIDEVSATSTSVAMTTGPNYAGVPLTVGCRGENSTGSGLTNFGGLIDEVAIFNVLLSTFQAREVMNGGLRLRGMRTRFHPGVLRRGYQLAGRSF